MPTLYVKSSLVKYVQLLKAGVGFMVGGGRLGPPGCRGSGAEGERARQPGVRVQRSIDAGGIILT